MSSVIFNNINALNAQRNLNMTGAAFSKSVEKLSSGLRINRAADDAAGLTISERMRAQIKGLNQANRNAQDGISMIQTAEGALGEVHAMLSRMYELATQAANDTLGTTDRTAIVSEMNSLQAEINATATRTKFNGQSLLSGNLTTSVAAASAFQNGAVLTANASVTTLDVSGAKAADTYTFTAVGNLLTLQRGSDSVAQTITVGNLTAPGAETLNFSALGVSVTVTSPSATGETGANIAGGFNTKVLTTSAASASANLQIGAYAADSMSVSFSKMDTTAASLNLDASIAAFAAAKDSTTAKALLSQVDAAITTVSTQRSDLGAKQNRLEHAINNIQVQSENITASESRIRDLDVAAEMVNFTRLQILNQAGTAILAQANQAPQAVLALLK